jgi:hypothetical protein
MAGAARTVKFVALVCGVRPNVSTDVVDSFARKMPAGRQRYLERSGCTAASNYSRQMGLNWSTQQSSAEFRWKAAL